MAGQCGRSKHGLAPQRISIPVLLSHPNSYHRLLVEQALSINAISLIGVTSRGY